MEVSFLIHLFLCVCVCVCLDAGPLDPRAQILALNDIFIALDIVTRKCLAERIKTIGNAYMAVSGMYRPRPDSASAAIDYSLAVMEALVKFCGRVLS